MKKEKSKCHRCACMAHCNKKCANCENCDTCDCNKCLQRFAVDG